MSAMRAASSSGQRYTPVETAGRATVRAPRSSTRRAATPGSRGAFRRSSGQRSDGPDRVDHPAGREASGRRRHRMAGPEPLAEPRGAQCPALLEDLGSAAAWMAPSTPPPPRSEEFAAFTMASTVWSVMSPMNSVMFVIPRLSRFRSKAQHGAAYDRCGFRFAIPYRCDGPLGSPVSVRRQAVAVPSGGGKEEEEMPVPVPQQGEALAAGGASAGTPIRTHAERPVLPQQAGPVDSAGPDRPSVFGSAAAGEAPHGPGLTLLVIEDDPAGPSTSRRCWTPRASGSGSVPPATSPRPSGCSPTTSTASCSTSRCRPRAADGDGEGDELDTLRHVLRLAPRHAVLALTAEADAERGAEAVRVGAQDYLFRDELDGRLLSRAIRYAVERKRADIAQRQLDRVPAARPGERPPGARAAAHARCWRAPTCASPPATAPAAPAPCSAATSTTPSARPTAPSTR